MNFRNSKIFCKWNHTLILLCLIQSVSAQQFIGIGTSSPQKTLHVRGNFRVGGTNSSLDFDSLSGKFTWSNARLWLPANQQLIQHSASPEGLYYNNSQLEYRNQFGNPVFSTNWASGNGFFGANLGVGTTNPNERLEVIGNIKALGLYLNTGGSSYDFLMQANSQGQVGPKKGYGALGVQYMIAVEGAFPSRYAPMLTVPMLGEVKLFAGNFAPYGWMFCEGQILQINGNQALFSLLGTTYGGDGRTTFALPDLRGAVPVHPGTSPAGYNWAWGERSY